jgi:hypothetical protein
MQSKLIFATRECEDLLINQESIATLLSIRSKIKIEEIFDEAWKNLLIAENHDAFVVPFTTPGQYSQMQGLEESKTWSRNETIEIRCLSSISLSKDLGFKGLEKSIENYNSQIKTEIKTKKRAYFNWLWDRKEIIDGKLISLPCMGYGTKLEPYILTHKVELKENHILIDDIALSFNEKEQILSTSNELISNCLSSFKGKYFTCKIFDCGSRVEIHIEAIESIELNISMAQNCYTSYPFGLEKKELMSGHCHRFYWDENSKLVFAHNGTPYYTHKDQQLTILIPKGFYSYAIMKAKSLLEAYQRAWEFFYPPVCLEIPIKEPEEMQIVKIAFNGTIPTALRVKNNKKYLRILSVDGSLPQFNLGKMVDFFGKPIQIAPSPWKILNFEF